jgi:protein gp37
LKTKIEWTDYTWNFISGCTQISPACQNCYAKAMTKRLQGMAKAKIAKMRCNECGYEFSKELKNENLKIDFYGKVLCPKKHEAFTFPMYYFGWDKVLFHNFKADEILDKKKYKSGSKIFVCSMSDLFHKDIDFLDIFNTFTLMEEREDLTFQVLTKRADRMLFYFNNVLQMRETENDYDDTLYKNLKKNVWLGVTAENQEMADLRIPDLLKIKEITGCKVFVSVEPMLESINLTKYLAKDNDSTCLDWVIVGGESGNRARATKEEWVIDLYEQCKDYDCAFFFKQKGNHFITSPLESHSNSFIENIYNTKEFPRC